MAVHHDSQVNMLGLISVGSFRFETLFAVLVLLHIFIQRNEY